MLTSIKLLCPQPCFLLAQQICIPGHKESPCRRERSNREGQQVEIQAERSTSQVSVGGAGCALSKWCLWFGFLLCTLYSMPLGDCLSACRADRDSSLWTLWTIHVGCRQVYLSRAGKGTTTVPTDISAINLQLTSPLPLSDIEIAPALQDAHCIQCYTSSLYYRRLMSCRTQSFHSDPHVL